MSNHNYFISYDEMVQLTEKIKEFYKKKYSETTVGDYGNFRCGTGRENLASMWSFTFEDSGELKTEDPYRPEDDENYQKFDNPANGLSNLLGLRSAKDE